MTTTLYSRGPSPFARKARFAIQHLGLDVEVVEADDEDLLRSNNPLAKIPVLTLDDGRALFDSRVILEYLDHAGGGGKIIPADPDARFSALAQAALADGVLEAALLIVYEGRYRPDQEPYAPWIDFQRDKIARGLAAAEAAPPAAEPLTVGAIGLACALDYLDFRKPYDWRPTHPGLIGWLDGFNAAYPAFADSRPSD